MPKRLLIVFLILVTWLFTGCQRNETPAPAAATTVNETAFAVSSPAATKTADVPADTQAVEATPDSGGSLSYAITQDAKSASVSLGMTYDEITALLKDADIPYVDGDCYGRTDDGEDQFMITFPDSKKKEYLSFSEDEQTVLTDIRWTETAGDESVFPDWVVSAIEKYHNLPLYYHSGGGNDSFVFPLDGGYYILVLDYGWVFDQETDDIVSGEVASMLSYQNDGESSSDTAYLLGEDVSLASLAGEENIADLQTVMDQVKDQYGETDKDGLRQSYYFEGIALYNRGLYYSIRWSQLVPDAESDEGHSSYNGQIYVSVDGNSLLTGYFNEIDG